MPPARGALISLLWFAVSCASLGRGQSEVDTVPLSESYRKFRSVRRTVYIQNFENRTYSPQLTGRLKEKLQYAFTRRPSLSVTPEKKTADLILYGKILVYSEEPGVYDRFSTPVTYNLMLVASAKMRVNKANAKSEALAEAEDISEDVTVRYVTVYNKGEPIFETRYVAEERMLDGIADRIVNSLYEPDLIDEAGK